MALTRRERHVEDVVDPFNAPDPVMPAEEPEQPSPSEADAGAAADAGPGDATGDAWVGSQPDTHEWHREGATRDGHAPADATPGRTPARRVPQPPQPDWEAQRRRKRRAARRVTIYLVVVIVLCAATVVPACVTSVLDRVSDDTDPWSYEYDFTSPLDEIDYSYDLVPASGTVDPADPDASRNATLEGLALQAVEDNLAGIPAGTDPYPMLAAQVFSAEFRDSCGLDPAEVGVDAQALATELLPQATFEVSDPIVYDAYGEEPGEPFETDAMVSVDAEIPDLASVAWDLGSYVEWDLELEPGDEPTEKQRRLVAEELDRLLAETDPDSSFVLVDVTCEVDEAGQATVVVDDASWDYAVRDLLGTW